MFFSNLRLVHAAWCYRGVGLAPRAPRSGLFEEIPAATSGIHWVHTAGKSRMKYLPESSGAGCAFLDYDNDGWMDIYLVNSGNCDFYHPASPCETRFIATTAMALSLTSPKKPAWPGADMAWESPWVTITATDCPIFT